MPQREVNGVRLWVEESGSGDPLLLVHGSWEDRHAWALIEQELARNWRVISYDRAGHSGSEARAGTETRRDDEDDLAALIETLEVAPANVVTHAFGGSIALGLAARRPNLIRTLCAHEPPLFALAANDPMVMQTGPTMSRVLEQIESGQKEAAAQDFIENVALGPGAWETLPAQGRETMIVNADTFAGELRDPGGLEIDLDALKAITAGVLLTQGDQSPPFFSRIIARLAEAIDGAEVETIPGAGHVPEVTHPTEYVGLINRFAGGSAG